ncbi:MAG: transketolase C-terminal domain-containing protein, partial [Sphingomicrobium sp.]
RPVTPWAKHPASAVPDGHYTVPLGKAAVVREGADLTVLTYGTMVHVSLAAVEAQGLDAEVIDLRTLVPLDIATIEASVAKTGRCLVVHEAPRTSGFGAELVALVQERCFYHLEAPVERVTGWDTPYPHSYEWAYFPGPKRIYNGPFDGHHDRPVTPWAKHPASEVPDGHYTVPLGRARVVRTGEALTVLAYGTMVHVALAAVEAQGIDAEVIDLRTLVPLDIAAIEASVEKTGRCLIAQEAPRTSGFAAELAALVQERCFYHLEAPVERVTGWDTPYPHSYEWAYFPGPKRIKRALEKVMAD